MSEMRRIMRDHDRHIQTIQEGGSIMQGLRGRISELESELTTLQSAHDKLNERVGVWKRIAEIRQYRNELNLHLIPGINEDALDSELYSLNLEEEKLLSILTPAEMEMS